MAGYAEPSLVFLLGTATELATPQAAAAAVAQARPAWVEERTEPAFRAALRAGGVRAAAQARVAGYDYSDGRKVTLTLWRAAPAPSGGAAAGTPPAAAAAPQR